MTRNITVITSTLLALNAILLTHDASSTSSLTAPAASSQAKEQVCPALLNHQFDTLQGKKISLCQYKGRVLLVVNTASYCGFTKQYEGLQSLHDKYSARGLSVIGFPANDFGKQEPGSNTEVADFCERTFKVKFPMMAKSSVIEGSANPLHESLAKATGQRPKWNFHKYLISRDGTVAGSFGSRVEPMSAEMVAEIEKLLNAELEYGKKTVK